MFSTHLLWSIITEEIKHFFFVCFSGFEELLGILVGHLYYFLTITYPQERGGSALIQTPQFL